MFPASFSRLSFAAFATGALLVGIFAALLIHFRADLRHEIRRKIIERDAAVLYPVALQQLADAKSASTSGQRTVSEQLSAVLKSAQQVGMLAVAVFNADGNLLHALPASLPFIDLPVEDYLDLTELKPISRYHKEFPLDRHFGMASMRQAPVLEVLLPLQYGDTPQLVGVVRYYIDARPLARELAIIDDQIDRQTFATLGIGTALFVLIVAAAFFALRRAQRVIAERNDRLTRANFELTLAAKTSALGQITSHLIHGLQGPIAGLRAVMAGRSIDAETDWRSATNYTERLQALIVQTVALLGETRTQTTYELTARELMETIRHHNAAAAEEKLVRFSVEGDFPRPLDNHRGSILCLITTNLVQNAIAATMAGRRVTVELTSNKTVITVRVKDEGSGIPENVHARLFEPGCSGRPNGSGLGLAISRLLARQINATLTLEYTGPTGTAFRLTMLLT